MSYYGNNTSTPHGDEDPQRPLRSWEPAASRRTNMPVMEPPILPIDPFQRSGNLTPQGDLAGKTRRLPDEQSRLSYSRQYPDLTDSIRVSPDDPWNGLRLDRNFKNIQRAPSSSDPDGYLPSRSFTGQAGYDRQSDRHGQPHFTANEAAERRVDSAYGSYSTHTTTSTISSIDATDHALKSNPLLDDASASRPPYVSSNGDYVEHSGSGFANPEKVFVPQEMPSILKCPKCPDSIFKTQTELKRHELRHTKPFKCEICEGEKRFGVQNDLIRHLQTVHKKTTKLYYCPVPNCKRATIPFLRLDNFRVHVRKLHPHESVENVVQRSGKNSNMGNQPRKLTPNAPEQELPDAQPGQGELETGHAGPANTTRSINITMDTASRGVGEKVNEQSSKSSASAGINPMATQIIAQDPCASQVAKSTLVSGNTDGHPLDHGSRNMEGVSIGEEMIKHFAKKFVSSIASTVAQNSSKDIVPKSGLSQDPEMKASLLEPGLIEEDRATLAKSLHNGSASKGMHAELDVEDLLQSRIIEITRTELRNLKSSSSSSEELQPTVKGISGHGKYKCPHCPKSKERLCDFKKHMKRHTKPYGCTFSKCNKTFGSKNDWKRHESSQHFQLEMWRCHQTRPKSSLCTEVFYRREAFRDHLKVLHRIKDEDKLQAEVKARKIGRNCQRQIWCGFCLKIISVKGSGLAAWGERFTHIAEHFTKEQKNVKDYVPADSARPKGDPLLSDGYAMDCDDSSWSPECDDQLEQQQPEKTPPPTTNKRRLSARPSEENLSYKKTCSDDGPPELLYVCCQCGNGPFGARLVSSCLSCDHRFRDCTICTAEKAW